MKPAGENPARAKKLAAPAAMLRTLSKDNVMRSVDLLSLAQPRASFPPVFGYDLLSVLLGRSVSSLQADKCRKPWSLPPSCTPPGVKSPLWLLDDVIGWLQQHRAPQAAPPAKKRKRGRPTKAEQVARQKARAGEAGHG